MEVYGTDFGVEYKDDNSPLTRADTLSNGIIEKALGELYPDIPIISEEGKDIPYETRRGWDTFWLVDPLDGTKEFVKRTGEFTVNVALVKGRESVWGFIYAPALGTLYYAVQGNGAWKESGGGAPTRINTRRKPDNEGYTVVQSRSHPSAKLTEYLSTLDVKGSVYAGSSLKFCMVAEGLADLYPRMGPTWEWDTAAGQAIVCEAGGKVLGPDGTPLMYNKPTLLNEGFIVHA